MPLAAVCLILKTALSDIFYCVIQVASALSKVARSADLGESVGNVEYFYLFAWLFKSADSSCNQITTFQITQRLTDEFEISSGIRSWDNPVSGIWLQP